LAVAGDVFKASPCAAAYRRSASFADDVVVVA
jgi:hypothetical protein